LYSYFPDNDNAASLRGYLDILFVFLLLACFPGVYKPGRYLWFVGTIARGTVIHRKQKLLAKPSPFEHLFEYVVIG
jgi:hypothetical protein